MADTPLAPPTETPQPPTSAAVGRRRFLAATAGVTAALLVTDRIPGAWAAPRAATDDPFTLGVASGDPTPTGVVLWTRLAPRPLDPDGGMPARAVPVDWEVASSHRMVDVVARGRVVASPARGHAVHVEVDGLEPGRHYWYRFRAGGHLSRLGRTKTCPDPGTPLGRLALAFVSCQSWESGYYTAYRHLAEEDLDVVLHLGDYIYETASQPRRPRRHLQGEATDLAGYRVRHALYKTDPDLQAAHASHPFATTWDDHEVENDHAGRHPIEGGDPRVFLRRRAAAYRAYWEHLPLRRPPHGSTMPLYRRLRFGDWSRSTCSTPASTATTSRATPTVSAAARASSVPTGLTRAAPSSAPSSGPGCSAAWTARTPAGMCSPSRWSWPSWTSVLARAGPGGARPGTGMRPTGTGCCASCGTASRPTRWC